MDNRKRKGSTEKASTKQQNSKFYVLNVLTH